MIKHLIRIRREGRSVKVEVCPEPGTCAACEGERTCLAYHWTVDPPTRRERLLGISHKAKLGRAVRKAIDARHRLDREHGEAAELVESYPGARVLVALPDGHPEARWNSDILAVGEEDTPHD